VAAGTGRDGAATPTPSSHPLPSYGTAFSAYIADTVLPALAGLRGEFLLAELWTRWSHHSTMSRWLCRFFNYLDRYYIARHTLHPLPDVALLRFRDEVFEKVKAPARDAVLAAVDAERAGGQVDRPLLKNVLSIFIEVGMGGMDAYEKDFEAALLDATAAHYRRQAAAWVATDTCPEYMARAEAALRAEEERVEAYLHASTRPRLLAAAETALLKEHQDELLSKEGSGVAALLAGGRKADLARMHRLFVRVPGGLDPVAAAFKAHVLGEGAALVLRGNEAAAARRERGAGAAAAVAAGAQADRSAGPAAEHQFVRDVVSLHDAYAALVTDCFAESSTFHKALKEAFEGFCNDRVGDAAVAELVANHCDALLKRGGVEKLSDDATDEALDKVVRLLAYIAEK
jgi:cullin 1